MRYLKSSTAVFLCVSGVASFSAENALRLGDLRRLRHTPETQRKTAVLLAQSISRNYTGDMKIAAIVGLSLVLIFLGVNVYAFVRQEYSLGASLADVQTRLTKAQADEASLQAEKQYLANPVNLEKELRARFNYTNPGEKMIIIVPIGTTSTTSTAVSD